MNKPRSIACLALAIALMAPAVAESASPVRGVWKGSETKYWTGSKWERYSQNVPVGFRLERGKVVRFGTTSNYNWPGCTGGETVTAKLPTTRKAKVRHGRFRGERTTYVGSRKMTVYVSGRFASARRARGKHRREACRLPDLPVGVEGDEAEAQRPRTGGGMPHPHPDLPWAEQVTLPDGTFYYNPCAYIAGRSPRP